MSRGAHRACPQTTPVAVSYSSRSGAVPTPAERTSVSQASLSPLCAADAIAMACASGHVAASSHSSAR